jgi:hypothetical protein
MRHTIVCEPGAPEGCTFLHMLTGPENEYVWRVALQPDDTVKCRYLGTAPIDTDSEVSYPTISDAPEWMQNHVAVLNMLEENPHTSLIEGVGRRVSATVFWVVQPLETVGGDDT